MLYGTPVYTQSGHGLTGGMAISPYGSGWSETDDYIRANQIGTAPYQASLGGMEWNHIFQQIHGSYNDAQHRNPWVNQSISDSVFNFASQLSIPILGNIDARFHPRYVICGKCNGGRTARTWESCPVCQGFGVVVVQGSRIVPLKIVK